MNESKGQRRIYRSEYSATALGYLFNVLGKSIDNKVASQVKEFGLEPRTLGILALVKSMKNYPQKDYALILAHDTVTFGRLVDKLVGLDFITRSELIDRRAKGLKLTDAGEAVLEMATMSALKVENEILHHLRPGEVDKLRELLGKAMIGLGPKIMSDGSKLEFQQFRSA
jgi:DNA-binding MarR family transcriptional regulator